MSTSVSGTFSGTGQSAAAKGAKIDIRMNFAGTATVDVEEQMADGNWIKVETGITSDYRKVFEPGVFATVRLNCTAHTNNVVYELDV